MWLTGAPLRTRKSYSPLNLFRGSSAQRACNEHAHIQHSKTNITVHSTQTSSIPTTNRSTALIAGGKRSRKGSYPGALCGQRNEDLPSLVARSLLLCRPKGMLFLCPRMVKPLGWCSYSMGMVWYCTWYGKVWHGVWCGTICDIGCW